MHETPNQVLNASQELGLSPSAFRQVGSGQWRRVLKRVFSRFANTADTDVSWLWEHLKGDRFSLQTDDGPNVISRLFESDTSVWILFEDEWGTKKIGNYWVFEGNLGAAVAVLNNLYFIEYYIVDRRLNWMILENHHGMLVAAGEPAESRLRESGTRVESSQKGAE
jgi:hypothetical protein